MTSPASPPAAEPDWRGSPMGGPAAGHADYDASWTASPAGESGQPGAEAEWFAPPGGPGAGSRWPIQSQHGTEPGWVAPAVVASGQMGYEPAWPPASELPEGAEVPWQTGGAAMAPPPPVPAMAHLTPRPMSPAAPHGAVDPSAPPPMGWPGAAPAAVGQNGELLPRPPRLPGAAPSPASADLDRQGRRSGQRGAIGPFPGAPEANGQLPPGSPEHHRSLVGQVAVSVWQTDADTDPRVQLSSLPGGAGAPEFGFPTESMPEPLPPPPPRGPVSDPARQPVRFGGTGSAEAYLRAVEEGSFSAPELSFVERPTQPDGGTSPFAASPFAAADAFTLSEPLPPPSPFATTEPALPKMASDAGPSRGTLDAGLGLAGAEGGELYGDGPASRFQPLGFPAEPTDAGFRPASRPGATPLPDAPGGLDSTPPLLDVWPQASVTDARPEPGPPAPAWFDEKLDRKLSTPFAAVLPDSRASTEGDPFASANAQNARFEESDFYASDSQIGRAVDEAFLPRAESTAESTVDSTVDQPFPDETLRGRGFDTAGDRADLGFVESSFPASAEADLVERRFGGEAPAFGERAEPDSPFTDRFDPPSTDAPFRERGFEVRSYDAPAYPDPARAPRPDPIHTEGFQGDRYSDRYGTPAQPSPWEPTFGEQVSDRAYREQGHGEQGYGEQGYGEQGYGERAFESYPPPKAPTGHLPVEPAPVERRARGSALRESLEPESHLRETLREPLRREPARVELRREPEPPEFLPPEQFDIRTPAAPGQIADEELRPAPAVWKQAHPSARRWADKRQRAHGLGRAPSPPRIASGLLLAGLGAWLLLSYLPARKPLTETERARISRQAGVDEHAWRFPTVLYPAAQGGAALYVSIGFLVAARGLVFRRRVEISCRRCKRTVVAERQAFGMRCENGGHSAAINWGALLLLFAVLAVSIGLVGLVVMANLRLDFGLGLHFD